MAWFNPRYQITVESYFTFNEAETRALDALIGYGADEFLKVFYEHMGEAYLAPHEDGLRSMFKELKESIPLALGKLNAARKALESDQ